MIKSLLCLSLLLLILLGCSAEQILVLNGTGGGSASLSFAIPSYMLEQADALQQNLPPGTPDFFEPTALKKQLQSNPGLKQIKVRSPRRGSMKIAWQFDNLNDVLQGATIPSKPKQQELLRNIIRVINLAGGKQRLELRITRNNYERLLADNPVLAENPIIQYYGPTITKEVNESDYYDLIAYAFGEPARKALATGSFKLRVKVPRPLIKVEGGLKVGVQEARFNLKLMEILYFNGAEVYALEY